MPRQPKIDPQGSQDIHHSSCRVPICALVLILGSFSLALAVSAATTVMSALPSSSQDRSTSHSVRTATSSQTVVAPQLAATAASRRHLLDMQEERNPKQGSTTTTFTLPPRKNISDYLFNPNVSSIVEGGGGSYGTTSFTLPPTATVNSTTSTAPNCSDYQQLTTLEPKFNLTLTYVADINHGIFRMLMTYQGQAWLGLALTPKGTMEGSLAVIGVPDESFTSSAALYNLGGYTTEKVSVADSQEALLQGRCDQNETHTVLEFELSMDYLDNTNGWSIRADGLAQNFLVAVGSDNTFGYHAFRRRLALNVTSCAV